VGEITIDNYIDLQRQFVGGISLNFAVHSKRCGAEQVSLVSCVGTDAGGQAVLARLAQEGVDASHVAVLPGRTAHMDIHVAETGERVFPAGGFHGGVLSQFKLDQADLDFIARHDIVVAPLFQQVEPIFRQVIQELDFRGKRVADLLDWADFGRDYSQVEAYLDGLDLVFISGNQDTVEALLPLSRHASGLIVVTQGAAGSVALSDGKPIHQPAVTVAAPVDTTGCGDAFQAAFTVAYFRSGDVRVALYRGAQQAAQVIQHYGAI
jgi:fructoselysine 6-kinase